MQYWLVERKGQDNFRYLFFCCTNGGRETAKGMAQKFLAGNPDEYIVTPITEPGEQVKMRINVEVA